MPFKLRSGNTSSFKSMGSSPMKNEEKTIPAQADANEKFEEKEFLENTKWHQERLVNEPMVTREETGGEIEEDPNWREVGETMRVDDNRGPRLNTDFIGPREEEIEEEHPAKGEDYIVDDGQDEIGRDEDGRIVPVDDGKYNPEFNQNKLHYLEKEVDNYLDNPMDRAYDKSSEIVNEQLYENTVIPLMPDFDNMENPDPLRHTLAAMYTSEKIGVIPTNILGAMHELTASNTTQEHKEDLLNNLIGSVIGSVPFTSTERKEEIVQKLWEKGFLFSGRPSEKNDGNKVDEILEDNNTQETEFKKEFNHQNAVEKMTANLREAVAKVKKEAAKDQQEE